MTVLGEARRCSACGAEEIGYQRMDELHRAIARALVDKEGRLAPPEVKFLRAELLLEGKELAQVMGTTPETVSRWETGAASMGKVADRLLRALVLLQAGVADYPVMRFRDLAREPARLLRLHLVQEGGRWVAKAKAAAA